MFICHDGRLHDIDFMHRIIYVYYVTEYEELYEKTHVINNVNHSIVASRIRLLGHCSVFMAPIRISTLC